MLRGCSSFKCLDQLYKSLDGLSSERHSMSQAIKDCILNPQCAFQFRWDARVIGNQQILPISEAWSVHWLFYHKFVCYTSNGMDPLILKIHMTLSCIIFYH